MQETLQKIIEKVLDRGYPSEPNWALDYSPDGKTLMYSTFESDWYPAERLIFSHDFLKAFWAEEEKELEALRDKQEKSWEFDKSYQEKLDAYLPFKDFEDGEKFFAANQNPAPMTSDDICRMCEIGWKHHAQQMVISEDPIEYLSKFV